MNQNDFKFLGLPMLYQFVSLHKVHNSPNRLPQWHQMMDELNADNDRKQ